MSVLQIVADEVELKKFYDLVMAPCNKADDEGWFISLSSRSKKMTDEERQHYKMTHKEMFAREILFRSDFESFKACLYSYHRDKRAFPRMFTEQRAIVCYMLTNPVSTGKAINEFKKRLTEYEYKRMYEGVTEIFKPFRNLENCYHISRAKKYYMDIDIDWNDNVPNDDQWIKNKIFEVMHSSVSNLSYVGADYFILKTGSGGIHLLVRVESLRRESIDFTKAILGPITNSFSDYAKEVKRNTNDMIPVPGTLQYGNLVKLL